MNLFDPQLQGKYDTLLLLMNGTGIAGKLERLPSLLNRLKELLADGGQILVDSSDLRYIYENEDGSMDINLNAPYYGEVDYQFLSKRQSVGILIAFSLAHSPRDYRTGAP